MHREDAEKFYRALAVAGQTVRVGMEARAIGAVLQQQTQNMLCIFSDSLNGSVTRS
jgi:hypothetical protein